VKITLKKIGDIFVPDTDNDKEMCDKLQDALYSVDISNIDSRTNQQNRAMHKLFSMTAEALNEAGYTMNFVLNRRKYETISKVFSWGKERILGSDKILDKMETRLLSKEEHELPWTMQSVKDTLWRPLQIHITNKESTTKLNKDEIDKVYEVFNSVLSRYGVHVPFPSSELWRDN